MKNLLLILGLFLMIGCTKKDNLVTEKVQKDIFYRLVTKDLDGTVTYSQIAKTKVEFDVVSTFGSGIENGTQTNDGGDDDDDPEDGDDNGDVIGSPLPLLLEYFKVYTKDNVVIANWKTTYEEDVVCFYIDRSEDGEKFTRVKMILPKGPGEYTEHDIFK